jgi:hypothetical protein
LVTNPAEDDVFAAFARLLVDHGTSSIEELQRRLRVAYPKAVVHPRELVDEPFLIWYVYRDGHWVLPGTGSSVADLDPAGAPDVGYRKRPQVNRVVNP